MGRTVQTSAVTTHTIEALNDQCVTCLPAVRQWHSQLHLCLTLLPDPTLVSPDFFLLLPTAELEDPLISLPASLLWDPPTVSALQQAEFPMEESFPVCQASPSLVSLPEFLCRRTRVSMTIPK